MAAWSFDVHSFLAPKAGLNDLECEDALAWNTSKRRFSLADGATEGFDLRRWARLLVKHWTRSTRPIVTTPDVFAGWTETLSGRFGKRWKTRALPWYAEEKARVGAFAAFVGLSFHDSGEALYWQSIALGDSCLLLRRHEGIVDSLPLSDPEAFNSRPILVPSNVDALESAAPSIVCKCGRVEHSDTFLLLSDAIAAWYLRSSRDHASQSRAVAFEDLIARQASGELQDFLAVGRRQGFLRNDDVAAIIVRVQQNAGLGE